MGMTKSRKSEKHCKVALRLTWASDISVIQIQKQQVDTNQEFQSNMIL